MSTLIGIYNNEDKYAEDLHICFELDCVNMGGQISKGCYLFKEALKYIIGFFDKNIKTNKQILYSHNWNERKDRSKFEDQSSKALAQEQANGPWRFIKKYEYLIEYDSMYRRGSVPKTENIRGVISKTPRYLNANFTMDEFRIWQDKGLLNF